MSIVHIVHDMLDLLEVCCESLVAVSGFLEVVVAEHLHDGEALVAEALAELVGGCGAKGVSFV